MAQQPCTIYAKEWNSHGLGLGKPKLTGSGWLKAEADWQFLSINAYKLTVQRVKQFQSFTHRG